MVLCYSVFFYLSLSILFPFIDIYSRRYTRALLSNGVFPA
jgi:hypothetical protein